MLSTGSAVALSLPLLQVAMSPAATTTGSLAATAGGRPVGLRSIDSPRAEAADSRANRCLVVIGSPPWRWVVSPRDRVAVPGAQGEAGSAAVGYHGQCQWKPLCLWLVLTLEIRGRSWPFSKAVPRSATAASRVPSGATPQRCSMLA